MAAKADGKEVNLVSSSIMLVNNPVTENMASYYPESMYSSQIASTSISQIEEYPYSYQENMGPFSSGTYYPYSYSSMDHMKVPSRNCRCEVVPVQDSFLHQILMGKGYKNDRLFVAPRPIIKQERDFGNYGCCYSYPMNYGYPVYPVYH
ncbi:hypothetical protein ACF0H5_002988 [Mactra antiquata]